MAEPRNAKESIVKRICEVRILKMSLSVDLVDCVEQNVVVYSSQYWAEKCDFIYLYLERERIAGGKNIRS